MKEGNKSDFKHSQIVVPKSAVVVPGVCYSKFYHIGWLVSSSESSCISQRTRSSLWELWHYAINIITECHNSHKYSESSMTNITLAIAKTVLAVKHGLATTFNMYIHKLSRCVYILMSIITGLSVNLNFSEKHKSSEHLV